MISLCQPCDRAQILEETQTCEAVQDVIDCVCKLCFNPISNATENQKIENINQKPEHDEVYFKVGNIECLFDSCNWT